MDPNTQATVPYEQVDSIAFEVSFTDADTDEGGGPMLVFSCDSSADGLKISWKPNYWGKIYFNTGVSAVHDMGNSSILKCYPNPADNILVIENREIIESVTVTNVIGQRVKYLDNLMERKSEINMSDLRDGIYFVTVKNVNGKISTAKILKK